NFQALTVKAETAIDDRHLAHGKREDDESQVRIYPADSSVQAIRWCDDEFLALARGRRGGGGGAGGGSGCGSGRGGETRIIRVMRRRGLFPGAARQQNRNESHGGTKQNSHRAS